MGPNGWWETSSQRSAIIESVSGGVLNVIEQNTWANSSKTNRRYVTRGTIILNWQLERGNYIVYVKLLAELESDLQSDLNGPIEFGA